MDILTHRKCLVFKVHHWKILFFLYDFFLHFISPFDLAQGRSFGHSDLEFVSDFGIFD